MHRGISSRFMNNTTSVSQIAQKTAYPILFAVCMAHLLNDMQQSVIPSVYPMLKEKYLLSFTQIGLITFTFQITASLLQPFVGFSTDKKPRPYSFVLGMCFTLSGLVLLSFASHFYFILLAVALVGVGSSIFHPEASRVAFLASGGRRGLAQSIFQLGGNTGSAIGPLLALIAVVHGQKHILWFTLASLLAIFVLYKIGSWYQNHLQLRAAGKISHTEAHHGFSPKVVRNSVVILLVLIFSKYFYTAGISNYFTFFLIDKFQLTKEQAQIYLFAYLAAVATGTLLGGPLGDRFGRKYIIWFSILGAAPFALMLPYANLFWAGVLVVIIGVIISSAFSAILVYAQELMPGKVGMISGLFFGFAFGMGGLGSAVLGYVADLKGIQYVFQVCAFLPLIGMITVFLPNVRR